MGTLGKYDVHSEAFRACKAASHLAFSCGEWQLHLLCKFTRPEFFPRVLKVRHCLT